MVHRGNLTDLNRMLSGGYRFDELSFAIFETRGVRILELADKGQNCELLGGMISAYYDPETGEKHPIYSIRDFVLWLHKFGARPDLNQLLEIESNGYSYCPPK